MLVRTVQVARRAVALLARAPEAPGRAQAVGRHGRAGTVAPAAVARAAAAPAAVRGGPAVAPAGVMGRLVRLAPEVLRLRRVGRSPYRSLLVR